VTKQDSGFGIQDSGTRDQKPETTNQKPRTRNHKPIMGPRSLRLNLILWFTLIFALVIAVSDYVTYRALRRIMLAELDSDLISMATLESAAANEGAPLDLETINRHTERYPRFNRQFVQIIDASDSMIDQFGVPVTTRPLLTRDEVDSVLRGEVVAADATLDENPIRFAAVAGSHDGKAVAVVVGTRAEGILRTVSRIGLTILLADVFAVIASIGGSYLIIGRALRPVDHIAKRARQIGSGQLHRRLEYVDSSAEMFRLTTVLNEMFDRLQRLFEGQKQFVQDASHEIRSPLTALRCRLELALRQDRSKEDYRQALEESMDEASRLSALAEDLFLLARVDSNNLVLELREMSVSRAVAQVHQQLAPMAEARGLEFVLETDGPCSVYADESKIRQALRNLAENALKYTPRGGRVVMSVRSEGEFIRADIEDTGIGIPVNDQTKIFDRFYRLDHARSRDGGGTGLGLAICDQIIRAHQGRIEVKSTVGHGSTFTVYLTSAEAAIDGIGS
jgi:heavy metal sensor kinase